MRSADAAIPAIPGIPTFSLCHAQVAEMSGHQGRVLHMATSPDGCSVVTAGADETLRFWRPFGDPPAAKDGECRLLGGAAGGPIAVGPAAGFTGLRSIR